MSNTVFAWRNWCTEVGTLSVVAGSFQSQAPASNMLTPQPGALAIASSQSAAFGVQFAGGMDSPAIGRPVHVIALLNHNIVEMPTAGSFAIDVFGVDGNYQPAGFPKPELFKVGDGQFQANLFWTVPETAPGGFNRDRVTGFGVSIGANLLCGRIDPITGEYTPEPFKCGGIWAGPVWRPDRGIRFGSFTSGITEARRGATSIGGQYYPLPQARRRRLSGDFTLTAESETFRLPESGFGLQQMAAWCGTSRPVICIPDITDPDLIYTQGIYGYFDSDLSWSHFDTSAKERQYRGSFSITEAL